MNSVFFPKLCECWSIGTGGHNSDSQSLSDLAECRAWSRKEIRGKEKLRFFYSTDQVTFFHEDFPTKPFVGIFHVLSTNTFFPNDLALFSHLDSPLFVLLTIVCPKRQTKETGLKFQGLRKTFTASFSTRDINSIHKCSEVAMKVSQNVLNIYCDRVIQTIRMYSRYIHGILFCHSKIMDTHGHPPYTHVWKARLGSIQFYSLTLESPAELIYY